MRKRVKMSAAADIQKDSDILACFGQVVPVQPAVPVRQTRPPYKLSGFVSRFHLGTAWWRGNTFRERSSAGGGEGDRVESLPSPNSKRLDAAIFSCLHFRAPTSIVSTAKPMIVDLAK